MRLAIEKQTLITISVFSLVALIIIGGVIYPTTREIKGIQSNVEDLFIFLERRYQRASTARLALKRVKEIQQTVAGYPQHFYKRGEELKLITSLEEAASAYKVEAKITNSNLDRPNDNPLTLSLSASGRYPQILQYLASLESLPYFLNVRALDLTPLSDRAHPNDATQAHLSLELQLYVN